MGFAMYRQRLKLFVVTFLIFTFFSCSKKTTGSEIQPPPPSPTASFSVSGTKILDVNGNEFIPKGVNVNGPYWPWARPTIPDVSLITDIWKANSVRVNCWPEFNIYNSNNTDIDGIVSAFTAKKVVVILEEHNYTGTYPNPTQLATLTAWWVTIANKYKNNPYVWFNIMNEPGGSGAVPADWLNDHDAVIKAIRNAGADNVIICDEHAFGQANGYISDVGSGVITYGQTLTSKYSNVIFSLHLYDQWVYGQDRLSSYVNAVHAKNLALIFGEYGVGSDNSMEVASIVYNVAIANKVGRICWHWDAGDPHKLTTTGEGGGFSIDKSDGSKPGNLSFTGNLVWDDLHGGIIPGSSELTPAPVIFYNPDFEEGPPNNGDAVGNGWINFGGAVIDASSANVQQGNYAVKVKSGSASGCGEPIYLQPGGTYILTAWGKNSTTPSSASNVGIKYQLTAGGTDNQAALLNFTETSYTQKSTTFTIPVNAAGVFLFIYKTDTAVDFWSDSLMIVKQ